VPVRFLVKLRGLGEVILVCNLKEKMLPVEWRTRTEEQWAEELLKEREGWPVEWEERMPSLRFVGSVEEA
jgi:hypothetical protein